jgi:hypothetical protein
VRFENTRDAGGGRVPDEHEPIDEADSDVGAAAVEAQTAGMAKVVGRGEGLGVVLCKRIK